MLRLKGVVEAGRSAKRVMRVLRGKDLWQRAQMECERVWLGDEGARWCVCPSNLCSSSVVYSFGVGEDISFDLDLIRRFGVQVHAFDPTPRSIEWVQRQRLPQEFVFHDYGVADFDGRCRFVPPVNPAHVSYSILDRTSPSPAIELPVYRLASIMKMLGHEGIDLVKMDIEGAEYGVLADLVDCAIRVKQILVEFHHRWPHVSIVKTKEAIRGLNARGFRIFSVSPNGEEYGFLKAQ